MKALLFLLHRSSFLLHRCSLSADSVTLKALQIRVDDRRKISVPRSRKGLMMMQVSPEAVSSYPLIAAYQMPSRGHLAAGRRPRVAESHADDSKSPAKDERKPRVLIVDDAPD